MSNIFRFKKFIEYQWKAKTKYYLHSPFIFQFYLNVLEGEVPFDVEDKYETLLYRLKTYFNVKNVLQLKKNDSAQTENFSFYDLIICEGNFNTEHLSTMNENSIFILKNIYEDEARSKMWNELKQHPSVTLTIDVFQLGICFFRKENFAKDDFILRY